MARRAKTSNEVDIHPDVALITELGFAGMEAKSDMDRGPSGPITVA